MKFDTDSPTISGNQKWRFCITDDKVPFRHYIEISQSEKSLNSGRMVTKNLCLRISDRQLIEIKEMIDAYFGEGKE